jgi:hypothetical protein
VVGQVPAGHAPAELGGAVRDQHRHAVAGLEGVGVGGVERGGARDHRADTGQVGRIEVGVEHHPQGGGDQADRAGPVAADGVGPLVDPEPLQQAERPPVVDALEHPEQPAHVHQRGVDDGDPRAQAHGGVAVALVVLGPDQHVGEGVVRQRHPLGRAGRPAGQHLDGHARPERASVAVAGRRLAADLDLSERRTGEPPHRRGERRQVRGLARHGADLEAGEVGPHPVGAPVGVGGDDAGAGP